MVYISPTGDVRVLMATANRTCANISAGSIPTGYRAIRLADFSGSGRADILLRNLSTGQNALWQMNASGMTLPAFTGNPDDPNASCTSTTLTLAAARIDLPLADATWQFYAAGDFNGDGNADIAWLRPDGTLTLWLMNGGSAAPTVIDNAGLAPAGFTVFQAGGGGATYYGPPAASVERAVAPVATDPAINLALESHFAINPSPAVRAINKLLVFLPGTGAVAQTYRLILRAGAARGYHAVGLTYPNDTAIGTLCDTDADVDCHGKARQEVITGESLSNKVDVNVTNSIVNRLTRLLKYLDTQYPAEGWGQFLNAGQPAWSRITVAGHSQGGGHAGLMAKLYSLDRAVYFSSPADWRIAAGVPATWITGKANVTPASRQFGFAHLRDSLVPYGTRIVPIWQALSLADYGAAISVDSSNAPFNGSHQLTTDADPTSFPALNPAHNATVVDVSTPKNADGTPLFTPVWNYLAFPVN